MGLKSGYKLGAEGENGGDKQETLSREPSSAPVPQIFSWDGRERGFGS
jgi:hypothetical protein